MQNVLVVGGAGFIGRHTIQKLAGRGCAVHATHHPDRVPDIVVPGVTWLPTDLRSQDAAANWPSQCDSIIYLAQARDWHDFPNIERDVFAVNVTGLMQTAWYAHRAGARRLIYASTGSVYTRATAACHESDSIDLAANRNFYTACKLSGELLLSPYRDLFSVVNLRIYLPYGPYQNPKMLLPRLLKSVASGIPIRLHGKTGLSCNPVAIQDVTEVMSRCLSLDRSVTMNVAGPETITLRHIVQTVGTMIGQEPVFDIQDDVVAPVIVGDTSLMREVLGWAPSKSFDEGVRFWLANDAPIAA